MFRIGVTNEFLTPEGVNGFGDIGLDRLTAANVPWEYLPPVRGEIPAEMAAGADRGGRSRRVRPRADRPARPPSWPSTTSS